MFSLSRIFFQKRKPFMHKASTSIIFKMDTWPTVSPTWNDECIKLLQDGSTAQLPDTNLQTIITKSRNFPIKFPITTNTCQNLITAAGKDILERNIKSAYPVIHENILYLCAMFLVFKQIHGTDIEKNMYENMTVNQLIEKLLKKRAVNFMKACDSYLLLDKSKGMGNWESVGSKKEEAPLILKNCLSYDEMKLSAFLSISSYNYFMNDGSRSNNGKVDTNRSNLEPEGIIVGLIGTRLEKADVMEYEELVITNNQNTEEHGYGDTESPSLHKLFAEFYNDKAFTYDEVRNSTDSRFVKLEDGLYFDNIAYAKRLALSFDTLLIEANHRARERGLTAYIHVVGIGLGVWALSTHQEGVFVQTFANRLSFLGKQLSNVSDVHFAYFSRTTDCAGYKDGEVFPIDGHPNGGITIHISRREPFTKLSEEGKLLVASYAWDGNALPGNEFWLGMLGTTGDSATAAASQIAELHNPHINDLVCADNLMIATLKGDILSMSEYISQLK